MKRLKVVHDLQYNKIGSFRDGNPYTIVFIYKPKGKPVIMKGGIKDIEYCLKHFKGPMMIRYTFWYHGHSRGYWRLKNVKDVYLKSTFLRDNIEKFGRPYVIINKNGNVIKKMRRIPRKWITELNDYLFPGMDKNGLLPGQLGYGGKS